MIDPNLDPDDIERLARDKTNHFALAIGAEFCAANARQVYLECELEQMRNPTADEAQLLGPDSLRTLTVRIAIAEDMLRNARLAVDHWSRVLNATQFVTAAMTAGIAPEGDENHCPFSRN